MADLYVTQLTALGTVASDDNLYIVDTSDTTDSADGTGKKIAVSTLLASISFVDVAITGTNTITAADEENGVALTITQNDVTNNPKAVSIVNAGTGVGVDLDQTGNGTALEIDNDGTDYGIYIHQDGVLAADKNALYVYSNAAQTNSALVNFKQDNASSDKNVLRIDNDGTGAGIATYQTGNYYANYIGNAGTDMGLYINQSGVLSSAYALYVYSNAEQTSSGLVYFKQDNSASDKYLMQLTNDGTGYGLVINQTNAAATNAAVKIDNSGTGYDLTVDTIGETTAAAGVTIDGFAIKDGAMKYCTLSPNDDSAELTISGGEVTVTQSFHSIDTEGDAASDDLVTITGGLDFTILIISAASSARSVVVKNGTGNIYLAGSDFTLDSGYDKLVLFRKGTNNWFELSRSNNGS